MKLNHFNFIIEAFQNKFKVHHLIRTSLIVILSAIYKNTKNSLRLKKANHYGFGGGANG